MLEEGRAQYNLGFLYDNGWGVPEDDAEAVRWYRLAADQGDASAQYNLGVVPHGFRSSFRDWAAEKTDHPREVAEAALAHKVRYPVEAAYRRTDLFERWARLMSDWAAYLAGES